MIEEDAIAGKDVVSLSVVYDDPIGVELSCTCVRSKYKSGNF